MAVLGVLACGAVQLADDADGVRVQHGFTGLVVLVASLPRPLPGQQGVGVRLGGVAQLLAELLTLSVRDLSVLALSVLALQAVPLPRHRSLEGVRVEIARRQEALRQLLLGPWLGPQPPRGSHGQQQQ